MKQALRTIAKGVTIVEFHLFLTTLLVMVIHLSIFQMNIQEQIDWIQANTRVFALILAGVFLASLLLARYSLRFFTYISSSTKRTRLTSVLAIIFSSILSAILVNFFFQIANQLFQVDAAIDWIQENSSIFLVSSIYLALFALGLYLLIGNVHVTHLLYLTVGAGLAYAHYNKMKFRSEPLYPSDFNQIAHVGDVIPMISEYLSIGLLLLIAAAIILLAVLIPFLPKGKMVWWSRLAVLPIVAFLLYSFTYYESTYANKVIDKMEVSLIPWNQVQNYKTNGFVVSFLYNMQGNQFAKPDEYDKKRVTDITKSLPLSGAYSTASATPGFKQSPNVIFLMSETFWDPTKLENLQFSEDPMPYIRSLMEEYPSGQILSPSFGGGTANVEFEALTGMSTSFLKTGTTPYQEMVTGQDPFPTIASTYKQHGYDTTAFHPYKRVYYKRPNVYEQFGFDAFVSKEGFEHTDKNGGKYISDAALTKEMIQHLEKTDEPSFMHVVSMQNHFPYDGKQYEEMRIDVEGLSSKYEPMMEEFAEGIKRTDEATKQLVEQLEQLDEPTLVVFWGDHLPILGSDKALYKEARFTEGKSEEQAEVLYHETPLFFYANYPIQKKELGTISPIYLPSLALEFSGTPKPPFYDFLSELKQDLPGIQKRIKLDEHGNILTKLPKKELALLSHYKLLEYDLLDGQQYTEEELFSQ
ncbi:MAG: LTA synthase family protein [Myxosarcina sp. JB018]|nr:LTA synthase family protein [Myxosarcina sp. JB018]